MMSGGPFASTCRAKSAEKPFSSDEKIRRGRVPGTEITRVGSAQNCQLSHEETMPRLCSSRKISFAPLFGWAGSRSSGPARRSARCSRRPELNSSSRARMNATFKRSHRAEMPVRYRPQMEPPAQSPSRSPRSWPQSITAVTAALSATGRVMERRSDPQAPSRCAGVRRRSMPGNRVRRPGPS